MMKEVDRWEQTCPLCGGDNDCAIAAGEAIGECWCRTATISARALAAIPAESVGRRCICATCGRIDEGAPVEG